MSRPLILTLQLDPQTSAFYETLRRSFYPPVRNVIPAHMTLFHQLPDEATTRRSLEAVARGTEIIALVSPTLYSTGRGVSIAFQSEGLVQLHARLAGEFGNFLIPQDRQRFRPHIVIQNKVSPDKAQQTMRALKDIELETPSGIGLSLWRYLDGPWQHLCDLPLQGGIADADEA